MKYLRSHRRERLTQSRPARGAWVEISVAYTAANIRLRSRPARGAWVEILLHVVAEGARAIGRAPQGARGLKYAVRRKAVEKLRSRPARGAWVEIQPVRRIYTAHVRRAPQGARGLKFIC